jgi:hypothetical protein
MKLKRILALAVSLAMILSIVPAFEFTASAADTTIVYLTNSFSIKADGTVETNLRVFGSNSGGRRVSLLGITLPSLDDGAVVTSAKLVMTTVETSNGATRVYVDDASSVWTASSTSATWEQVGYGQDLGEDITSTLVEHKGAGQTITFDITSFVNSNITSGNEFIALRLFNFDSSNNNCCGFYPASNSSYKPYLELTVKNTAPVTVKYVTASGSELATRTETGFVGEDFTVTNTTNDNYIVIDKDGDSDGYLAVLLNSETKTVESTGTTVTVTVKPVYAIKSENLYPNSEDEIDNWTLGNGGTIGSHASLDSGDIVKSTDNPRNGKYSAMTTVGWTSADGGGWKGSNKAIVMFADVNANSKYYFAGAYYPGSSNGTEMTIGTVSTAGDITSVQGVVAGNKNLSNGGITSFNGTDTSGGAGNGKFYASCNGKYNQMEQVVTTDDDSVQFVAAFYWLCDSGTSYFDDFMLYEIEDYVEETKSSYDFKDAVSVPTLTKSDLTLPEEASLESGETASLTWTSSDESVLGKDGKVGEISQPTKVTLTETIKYEETAEYSVEYEITVFPKALAGGKYTDSDGLVYNVDETSLLSLDTLTVASDKNNTKVLDSSTWLVTEDGDVKYATTTSNGGSGKEGSVRNTLNFEENTKYLVAITTKNLPSGGYTAFWTGTGSDSSVYDFEGTSDWTRQTGVYDSSKGTTVDLVLAWLSANSTSIESIEICAITPIETNITVNYVCGDVTLDTKTVDGHYVGESYTVTDIPGTISYNNTTYVPDTSSDTLTKSLAEGENVFEVSYREGTIVDTTLSDSYVTRAGFVPTLPTTVTADLENNAGTVDVNVTWNYPEADTFATIGDVVPVTGSVSGSTAVITANVTVVDKDYFLLARYEFEDDSLSAGSTLEDSVNGYSATVVGGDLESTDGIFGKALNLNGNGYLQLDDNLTQAISDAVDAGEGFTISTFVQKNKAQNQFLFSMHGTAQQAYERAFGLIDSTGSDALRFEGTKDYQATTPTRKVYAQSGTRSAADEEYVQLTVTFDYTSGDGTGLIKFYVDGVDVTDTSRGTNLTNGKIDFTPSQVKAGSLDSLYTFIGLSPYPGDGKYNGYIDDFKIYSVALTADEVAEIAAKQSITISYKADGAEVATETVSGYPGQTITLPAVVSGTDGKKYEPEERSYTIVSGTTQADVTVVSTVVTASAEDVSVTVIGDNEPVLPQKVKVSYSDETSAECAVSWNGYTGTVTTDVGEITITANVTKLDETFALSDMSQSTGKTEFPVAISDEFCMEFDYTSTNGANNWIYISKDGALWGAGQVGLGTGTGSDSGMFKFQPESTTNAITIGETYRIFLTIKPSSSTYDAVMYSADGTVFKSTTDCSFRTSSDTINSVYTTNNGASGAFTLTNVKVYAPSVADQLTKYTVKFEGVDRADETAYGLASTISALPANAYLPDYKIPEIEGYVFEDYSLSGTTYTLTYSNAKSDYSGYVHDTYSRINPTVGVMNLLGAHDAFTAKMSTVGDAAAAMGGDSGSKVAITSSNYVNSSKAQSAGAFGLLDAGVRYFDVRLTASDATETVSTKTATGTNGEYYTTHAYLGQPFKTILYTIRDYARENPGEIIILDFQEIYNSIGDLTGGHDNSSWDAAWNMVVETGVSNYVYTGTSSKLSDLNYNTLTSNGTKTAVVLIGKPGSQNTQSSHFFRGGDRTNSDGDTSSNIYSYWESSLSSYSKLTSDIPNNQVANAPESGRIKVMQAMYGSGTANLITNAKTTNPKLIQESDFETWLATLPIVMLDDAAVNSSAYIELFKSYVKTYTVQYVAGDTVLKSFSDEYAAGATVITTTASDAYYLEGDDNAYIVSVEANTYTTDDAVDEVISIPVTIVHSNATVADVFANADGSADCNNTSNLIFAGANNDLAAWTDADGVRTSNVDKGTALIGGQRVGLISFKVPDVSENEAVTLNTYVAGINKNIGGGNWMKVAVNPISGKITDSGAGYAGYKASDYKYDDDTAIWSETAVTCSSGSTDIRAYNNWIKFDVTEAVQAAKAAGDEYITFKFYVPHAGVYIADREKAGIGGTYEGKAAYLEVSEGTVINVEGAKSVTKNGGKIGDNITEVVVADGSYINATPAENTIAFVSNGVLLVPDENGNVIVENPSEDIAPATFDIDMVIGAQVRVGTGVSEGKIPSDSGLRFIAQIDKSVINGIASLAEGSENVEFGIAIQAEGSDTTVYVPCKNYQDEDSTVFTAVLTNLNEGNYNRNFTATPYVKVGDNTFMGNSSVTRSIYQVSAGILSSQSVEGGDALNNSELSSYVKTVLNTYINKVGIRLGYDKSADSTFTARTSGNGAYTGDVFFSVDSEAVGDGTYNVTVTLENWDGLKLSSDWMDSIRVNNNHSTVISRGMITNENVATTDDGVTTLTFNFNPNATAE